MQFLLYILKQNLLLRCNIRVTSNRSLTTVKVKVCNLSPMSLQRSFQHDVEVQCEIYESQVSASTTVVHYTQQILCSFLHVLNQEIVSFFPPQATAAGGQAHAKAGNKDAGYYLYSAPLTGDPVEL